MNICSKYSQWFPHTLYRSLTRPSFVYYNRVKGWVKDTDFFKSVATHPLNDLPKFHLSRHRRTLSFPADKIRRVFRGMHCWQFVYGATTATYGCRRALRAFIRMRVTRYGTVTHLAAPIINQPNQLIINTSPSFQKTDHQTTTDYVFINTM